MKLFNQRPNLAAYEAAKKDVTSRIVQRFSRGNVNVQNGYASPREKLISQSREADAKAEKIRRMVEAG